MLVYSAIASLDGYTNDADGKFEWSAPDEEVHAFVNERERGVGTYLYGRRMYDVMRYWQDAPADGPSAAANDYAEIWRAADKIVYSATLDRVTTPRTRLERRFDAGAVRALKERGEVGVGGATLAAAAIEAGLVDEYRLFVVPFIVGGGTPVYPGGVRAGLELLDQRRFDSGVVYLRYRPRG